MILGFMLGWAAATAYWAWVASLYDKPKPPEPWDGSYNSVPFKATDVRAHWRTDGGP